MREKHYEPSREDFQNAIKDLDTYIDITMDDLLRINQLAKQHAQLRQTEQVTVRDLMSVDVVTVNPSTTVKEAAQLLLEHRISGLPVVDENQKLVGIITEADFLTTIGIPCHHPTHSVWHTLETMFKHQAKPENTAATVGDIMVRDIITIDQNQSLHEVIQTMKQHHIKRLIVTDEQQRVQGIITRSNLVRLLLQQVF